MTDTAQIAGIAIISEFMLLSLFSWFIPADEPIKQHKQLIINMWLMTASLIIAVAIF